MRCPAAEGGTISPRAPCKSPAANPILRVSVGSGAAASSDPLNQR